MRIVLDASHWPGDETERRSAASGHVAIRLLLAVAPSDGLRSVAVQHCHAPRANNRTTSKSHDPSKRAEAPKTVRRNVKRR